MNRLYDLARIIHHYGDEHQLIKAQEELGECAAAISRYFLNRDDEQLLDNLVEELADVSIMVNQLVLTLCIGTYQNYYNKKIDRQINRIEKEKENERTE